MWKTAYPNTNLLFWKQTPFLLDWMLAFWLVYSLSFHPKSNLEPRNVQTKCCSLWLQSHVMQDFVWKLKSISHLDFQDECWIDLGNFTALKNKGCLTIAKAQHDKGVLYNSLMPLYSSHAEFLHSSAKEPGMICDSLVLDSTISVLVPTTKTFINNVSWTSSYFHLMTQSDFLCPLSKT